MHPRYPLDKKASGEAAALSLASRALKASPPRIFIYAVFSGCARGLAKPNYLEILHKIFFEEYY